MKKFCLVFSLGFLLNYSTLMSQHHTIEMNGGAMFGILKTNKLNQIKWGNKQTFSLGANQNVQIKYLYFSDSSLLNFEMGSHYNWGKTTLAQSSENRAEQSLKINSNFMQMELGFGIHWKIKHLKFRFSHGMMLPMLFNNEHQYAYKDSVMAVQYSSKIKNYQSVGYYSQLSVIKSINDKIALRFSVDFNFLNVRIKSEKVSQINHSKGLSVNEYFTSASEREFLFYKDANMARNNKDALPQFFKPDKPSEFIAYKQSYSGIGFKIGFVFQ